MAKKLPQIHDFDQICKPGRFSIQSLANEDQIYHAIVSHIVYSFMPKKAVITVCCCRRQQAERELHTHTQTFNGLFPGQPGSAGTRRINHSGFCWSKRCWGGSGISWTICKSFAPCSRQITTPAPHHSIFFTGRMPFLPPNQQRQSTEGKPEKQNPVFVCAPQLK